jgi:SNF2-related domain
MLVMSRIWNNFANIFKHKNPSAPEDAAPAPEPILDSSGTLTVSSPRHAAPPEAAVELWAHQEAMIACCLHIETNPRNATITIRNIQRYQDKKGIPTFSPTPIGVMSDPPGSGKTYAILSLIALKRASDARTNLIVVPQNIYTQWELAIKKIYPPSTSPIKSLFCNNYATIASLYGNAGAAKLAAYDIVLLNDVYAETILTTINDTGVKINRLIIDEIDSIQDRMYTPIPCKQIWLVSASFEYNKGRHVGPYYIAPEDIESITCRCSPEFVAQALKFEDPIVETITCQDTDIQLFAGFAPDEAIVGLNTGDARALIKFMGKDYPPKKYTTFQLAEIYFEDLKKEIAKLEGEIAALEPYEAIIAAPDEYTDEEVADAQTKVSGLPADRVHLNILRVRLEDVEGRLAAYQPPDETKTKTAAFEDICRRIEGISGSKWLIVNDNAQALYDIGHTLTSKSIPFVMLDGGSTAAIHKAIRDYKSTVRVMLLNSTIEAAGLNLENTTHLVFMHAVRGRMVEQIVGRAQRYGRVGPLTIIGLFNENESATLHLDSRQLGKRYEVEVQSGNTIP